MEHALCSVVCCAVRARDPRFRDCALKRLLLASSLTVGALVTTGTVVAVNIGDETPRTAPGTTLGGLAAGDLDARGLRALLSQQQDSEPSEIRVVLGTRSVTVRNDELGLELDEARTVERALAESPAKSRFGRSSAMGQAVEPVLDADPTALEAVTSRLAGEADVPESHGRLIHSGDAITAEPPVNGQGTTAAVVETALQEAALALPRPAVVTVPVDVLPAHVTAAAVQALADQANTVRNTRMAMVSGDRSSVLSGRRLSSYLTVIATGDSPGHGVTLGLSAAAAKELAVPIATALTTAVTEPDVEAPVPTSVLTAQGSVTWKPQPATTRLRAAGRTGQTVTADAVLTALLDNVRLPTPARRVVVRNTTALPKSTDEEASRINALLGTFTTPFACCQPRVHNITLMAKTIDETLIAPGETFSLNGIVGERTKEKGYVEAPYILDGELSTDIGGGVSQVATTTLNAAFFAGLRLDRHQAHSFYISRYPAGREATVNYPTIDLAWTNTTDSPVLLRAKASGTSLSVAIYGRDDGRTVEAISGPRRPIPNRDFRITITRLLRLPGRVPQKDSFTTTYNQPPEDH